MKSLATLQQEFSQRIHASGLEKFENEIFKLSVPAIFVAEERASDEIIPIGVSKMGGRADLAPHIPWPHGTRSARPPAPLHFIAQFNLAELVGFAGAEVLPPSGLLSFFYEVINFPSGSDLGDRGGFEVLYQPDVSCLQRAPFPAANESREIQALAPRYAKLESHLSFAEEATCLAEPRSPESLPLILLLETPERLQHQLLGIPYVIQNPMEEHCESLALQRYGTARDQDGVRQGAKHWRHVFSTSRLEEGLEYGDSGTVYYWIRDDDLKATRFEESWMIMQDY